MATATPRAKCLKAIQLLCRVAAADDNGYCTCVTCGVVQKWNEGMQGGHYIAKGKSSYWSLRIENLHPQCAGCNGYGMRYGNAESLYTLWMVDYYGRDFVDEMHRLANKPIKLYKRDYEEMLEGFNKLISEHKKRIGAC